MLTGDVNGRVAQMSDFIPSDPFLNDIFDIDLASRDHFDKYILLENLAIPLSRTSKDKITNANGLMLIDLCRNNNLFIANGRLSQDKNVGEFTFREKSVIDYLIASAVLNLLKTLKFMKLILSSPTDIVRFLGR
jgi:hypothetical protein